MFELKYNTVEYDICKTQGKLFEWVANQGIDMEWFVDFYMHSKFCNKEMDSVYSFYQIGFPAELFEFIEIEADKQNVEIKHYNNKYFNGEIANFVGFTYRHLHYVTNLHSSELIEKVPFDKLCNSFSMHSLDENMAVEMLCEQFKLNQIER